MLTQTPPALCRTVIGADWRDDLVLALDAISTIRPDLLVLFPTYLHDRDMVEIAQMARERSGAKAMIGCSGIGVVGMDREYERCPAISVMGYRLPEAEIRTVRFDRELLDFGADPAPWRDALGFDIDPLGGIIALLDPFQIDAEATVSGIAAAYPGTPIVGGIASPGPNHRNTWLFLDDSVSQAGGVAIAIGGGYQIVPIVSQGCEPIGEPWTITSTQHHWILTISNRPALEVLQSTIAELPADRRAMAEQNLVAGLAADEYRHQFVRGDFVIRNLVGIDQGSGAIAIGAVPRTGQTIQFQIRDAATADLDLTLSLEHGRVRLDRRQPIGGLVFTCNGRGSILFGTSHHDALAISRKLGGLPVSGSFCAGEIGPIGGHPFIHGQSASLGLIVRD